MNPFIIRYIRFIRYKNPLPTNNHTAELVGSDFLGRFEFVVLPLVT
jgi:hypothetical protein